MFRNNLGWPGTIFVIVLLLFGLRSKLGYNFANLPPNFMEFNMYVHTMVSPIDEEYYPEVYYENGVERKHLKRSEIKDTLAFGFLFQNDRWGRDERLIYQYFCNESVLQKLRINKESLENISIEYLKNGKMLTKEVYNVECN